MDNTIHHFFLSKQLYRYFGFLPICLLLLASHLYAGNVSVDVLGIPGHQRLIRELRERGYSASLYGPTGRAADEYQVISIGEKVPPRTAVDIIHRAMRIQSLKYVILTADRERPASGPFEIAIGVTSKVLDQFPGIRPFSTEDLRRLRRQSPHLDAIHRLIRSTYAETGANRPGREVYIRPDGVLVVPNPDGTAKLYSRYGQRGFLTKEGQERWLMQDLAPKIPVKPAGSADQAWIEQMDSWLQSIGKRMLAVIEIVLDDDESMRNYKGFEQEKCKTLFERITMRHEYLSLLIKQKFNTAEES